MTNAEFERLLQECWDERRDPADDPQLCAWLLEHPEALEDFARRRAAILALAATHAPARRRSPVRLVLLAAALVAAAALLLRFQTAARPPAGRILAATLETSRPRAHSSVTWREHQVLCDPPHARLEIIQHKSERR
jgi:hypothetical protein